MIGLWGATMNRPISLREILQAKVTSLEELAGQLKSLSEFKQSIAEDREYPPHNADELQKKAREHKRDGMAAVMAFLTLKAVLDHGKTEAQQISLMQHYVLEFGQSMSRNVKLSNSLPEDDPEQEKIDQDGFSASFVVNTLNEILGDIEADSRRQTASKAAAHPTMAGRFGQVLSWTTNLIAVAIIGVFFVVASYDHQAAGVILIIGGVLAGLVWMAGRALRYVLAGA